MSPAMFFDHVLVLLSRVVVPTGTEITLDSLKQVGGIVLSLTIGIVIVGFVLRKKSGQKGSMKSLVIALVFFLTISQAQSVFLPLIYSLFPVLGPLQQGGQYGAIITLIAGVSYSIGWGMVGAAIADKLSK